jgi:hypothetical protein
MIRDATMRYADGYAEEDAMSAQPRYSEHTLYRWQWRYAEHTFY